MTLGDEFYRAGQTLEEAFSIAKTHNYCPGAIRWAEGVVRLIGYWARIDCTLVNEGVSLESEVWIEDGTKTRSLDLKYRNGRVALYATVDTRSGDGWIHEPVAELIGIPDHTVFSWLRWLVTGRCGDMR